MFENLTYDVLLNRMLAGVPNTLDKREGSIIYDALAPAAVELKLMYIELDRILQETFADTASREYLILRTAERGITPNLATKAVLKGEFNIDVDIGVRFSLGQLNYKVVEKLDTGEYKLECETAGTEGNANLGRLIPIDYISGLESAELTELLIPGEDEESTESLRQRYFENLSSQAFGGNVSDYKEKVNALDGVSGVKVYPVWNGGGTVKLTILNSEFHAPSETLLSEIQSFIDPVENAGEGVGIAPIGHVVTVEGVKEERIHITTNLTYEIGRTWEDVQDYVFQEIDDYFLELSKTWQDEENLIVRISQIETRLLGAAGIMDISGTSINDMEQNYVLDENSIPIRGDVSG